MNVSTALFLSCIAGLLFTCASPQNPFSQDKADVFLRLESSTKTASDSTITDTTGNTIGIGVSFFMPQYFDSVVIVIGKSIQDVDTFFVCRSADIINDSAWFSYVFKSAGVRTVTATGYVQGGYKPSATALISVIARIINHKPYLIITGQRAITTVQPCSLFVSASDSDTAQTHTFQVLTGPSGYTFANQIFAWKPSAADTGVDTVTFMVSDNGYPVMSDTQKVFITVANKPDVLHAYSQAIALPEDSLLSIMLSASPTDTQKIKTWQVIDSTRHGKLTGTDSIRIYTPTQYYNGLDTFSFRVSDGTVWSDTGWITITVMPINIPPVIAVNLPLTVQQGGTISILPTVLSATDVDDPASGLTWTLTTLPVHGTVKRSNTALAVGGTFTQNDIDSGIISYKNDSSTTASDSLLLSLKDKGGLGDTGIIFHIKIGLINYPPHSVSQAVSTKEDSNVTITLHAIDPEGQQIAAWQIIDSVKHGNLNGTGNVITYAPKASFFGADTLTFRASDGNSWGDTGIVAISVVGPQQFKLAVNAANGTVAAVPVGPVYDSGTTVTLTATPASAHRFGSWSGDLTGTNAQAQLTMTSNKTITANFITQFILTVAASPANGGSVTGSGTVDSGVSTPISCSAASGYQFAGWAITSGSASWATGSTATTQFSNVELTSNATLTANLVQLIAPTISVQPTASQTARIGDTITLSVTATGSPAPTYQWYKNGTALTGKTASSMQLNNIQKTDSAAYYVTVANAAQNITSHDAVVIVLYAKSVYAGSSILFITNDGALWGCGSNWMGQIGDGTTKDVLTPKQIMTNVISASNSAYNSLMLKADGTLWGCGDNSFGQLGDTAAVSYLLPKRVANGDVIAFSSGGSRSYYVSSYGQLWSCGQNYNGDLGNGTLNNSDTFALIPSLNSVNSVQSALGNSAFIITQDGTLWACGANSNGQLGDGTDTDRVTPKQILSNVSQVGSGARHTIILRADGTAYGCGDNSLGQLGGLPGTNILSPTPIPGMTGVAAASAGGLHSIFLKRDSTLWACGYNGEGELGDSAATAQPIPTKMANTVIGISASSMISVFIKSDGTLWGCGKIFVGDSATYENSVLTPKRIF